MLIRGFWYFSSLAGSLFWDFLDCHGFPMTTMMSLVIGRKLGSWRLWEKGKEPRNLFTNANQVTFLHIKPEDSTEAVQWECTSLTSLSACPTPAMVPPLSSLGGASHPNSPSFLCKAPPSVMFFLPISDDVTSSDKLSLVPPKSCSTIFLRTLHVPFVTRFMLLKLVHQSVVGWMVAPQKLCSCLNLWDLWMWPYLEEGSLQV